jgi:hypothetical protein
MFGNYCNCTYSVFWTCIYGATFCSSITTRNIYEGMCVVAIYIYSLYVYLNVKCLHSVYWFLVTILFMDFKPIKYFWFLLDQERKEILQDMHHAQITISESCSVNIRPCICALDEIIDKLKLQTVYVYTGVGSSINNKV